jgi:aquaporin Z
MATATTSALALRAALRDHWPEYLIEAAALGLFMVSAGVVTTLLEFPGSPLRQLIDNAELRHALIGVAMGLTAVALTYSPWGQRSGAHLNPAVTLAFWRLGKVARWDAAGYIVAQCLGGLLGVLLVCAVLREAFTAPPVNYVATLPGPSGRMAAFVAEFVISALLMWVVLTVSNHARFAKYTGICAGVLVALYITVEGPISGMSMNPARSLASAAPGGLWMDFWIYVTAPVLGMQSAAGLFLCTRGRRAVGCAKLLHSATQRCIHCGYQPVAGTRDTAQLSGEMR